MTRLQRLQEGLKKEGIDACCISDNHALDYFIDRKFSCGERLVVLVVKQEGKPILFLNQLFPLDDNEKFDLVVFNDTQDSIVVLAESLKGTVAIDKVWPSGFLLKLIALRPDLTFVDGNLVDRIRSIKDETEKEKMRQASKNNDAVMDYVRTLIQPGKTEIQLAEEIVEAFAKIASSEPSFETIVAFKENCADPHAIPSSKVLEVGMSVIVDMGCLYQGYCSDMTRTYFLGENTMPEIYDAVLKANLAAIACVKPGIPFKEVDQAARSVIEKAGYGEYFIHRTGHGIGLSVHEPFDVSAVDEIIIEEGMCFSIEPGIYIPQVGGVRIEDLVLVTKEGCEVLNHNPKDQPVVK